MPGDALSQIEERINAAHAGGDSAPLEAPTPAAPAATPETPHQNLYGALRGFLDTETFGLSDEIGGAVQTVFGGDDPGIQSMWQSGKSFGDTFAANVAINRRDMEHLRDTNTKSYVAGQLAGAAAIPIGAGAKGALGVAKVGAAQGAAYGAGSGEGVVGRLESAAEGAVLGGVVGGVVGKVAPYLVRGAKALGRAVGIGGKAVEEAAPEAIPASVPLETQPVENAPLAAQTNDGRPVLAGETKALPAPGEAAPTGEAGAAATGEAPAQAPQEIVPIGEHPEGGPAGDMDRDQLINLQNRIREVRDGVTNEGERTADINPENAPATAARVGDFRIGNLGSEAESVGLIRGVAETLPPKATRTDLELMTRAKADADAMGEDPEAVLATAKEMAGKLGDVDTTMATLRTVWGRAADQVSQWAMQGVDWATATPEAVQTAAEAIRNLKLLSWHVQNAKAGLGRGLRVMQLPGADEYLRNFMAREAEGTSNGAPLLDDMLAPRTGRDEPLLPRTPKEVGDFLSRYHMLDGNPKAQAQYVADGLTVPSGKHYLRTSAANWFTANILSAPKTLALNIVGPAMLNSIHNLERMVGSVAIMAGPTSTMAARAEALNTAKATAMGMWQMMGDVKDVFGMALKSASLNKTIIGGGGQSYDALTSYGPFTDNLLSAANVSPNWQYTLGNAINWFPRHMAQLNNGLDEFAKRLTYQGEVRVRALQEGLSHGLEGQTLADHVAETLHGSYDAAGHAADEEMLRVAERSTLTSTPGVPGGWINKGSKMIAGLRRDIPELRFLLPVFNVSVNGLGEAMRRLPIAHLAGSLPDRALGGPLKYLFEDTAADLAGDNGPVAQAEAHGRTLLGAGFLSAGLLMNKAGLLTGAGPQDPQDRKTWLQVHQPYSIRVGDEWVRYDKFDVAGALMAIPATISDATTFRSPDESVGHMLLAGSGALAQWFKDRAALHTAMSLLNVGSDPTQNAATFARQLAGSVAAGMIPASAFVQNVVTNPSDQIARQRHSWTDYMRAALPGLSQTLEPVRNVFGEPMPRAANTVVEGLMPLTMSPMVSWQKDPQLDELDRLYRSTGYGAGADPASIGHGFFDPKATTLEDGRSLFDHIVAARQSVQLGGKTLREAVGELIASPIYMNGVDSPDADQAKTSLGDVSRPYLMKQLFGHYEAQAKATLASSSPIALAYLTAAAAKLRDAPYLQGVAADDLVKNPELYDIRGINAAGYSAKIQRGGSQELLDALGH